MRLYRWQGSLVLAIAAAVLWTAEISAGAAPAGQVTVVEGTIAAVNGSSLTIAPAGGAERAVKVEPDTLILSRRAATLGAIKRGDALGVAAKRAADGSLTAISINIFSPELWSRVHKGQFPMESGDVMTNAEVAEYADRVEGRTLYMKYNEGTAAIIVPAATKINRLTTVGLSDLRPGMRVTVRGVSNPDGTIKASSITFDQPG